MVHLDNYYSVLPRNELSNHQRAWRHITKWKIPSWKGYIHMIPTVRHSGKGKITETIKKTRDFLGFEGKEEWLGGPQRIFKAIKVFFMIL